MSGTLERVLVTGGAGFIGSNLVRHLLAHTDARVVVVDKLTYAGNLASLDDVAGNPRFRFVRADIADQAALAAVFAEHRPTAVANLAAESHVDRSIEGPRAFVHSNLVGAFEVLETARQYWDEADPELRGAFRLLQVSTDEVFGSLPETGSFRETTPYDPRSPYSASKAGADHLARAWHTTFGLPVLLTNCSNNYGPFQYPEKLIPLMIRNAIEGKPLPIYGDGQYVRDWLFVDDHCSALRRVLERGRSGESYNVGGDCELPNLEVIDRLCAILELELPAAENSALAERGVRSYAELKTFVEDRPGHDRRYAMDFSKLRSELGWTPAHDFDAGLAETVRWYLAHEDWCTTVEADRYDRERLGLLGRRPESDAG
jgi:dTDP-glucose 4,6-dehydratase